MTGAGGVAAPRDFLTGVLALGQLLSWGAFYYALPVFVAPISAELGWSREIIFWGLSAALLTSVVVAPAVGRRIDGGRGKSALLVGQLAGGLSLLVLALTGDLWLFLLLCCGIGISQGACLYDTAFSLLHRYLGTDAPRAIIRVTLVAGLAGTIFVPAAQFLVEQLGWRLAAFILGGVGLLPCILYLRFLPDVRAARETPFTEDIPLAPLRWNASTIALVAAFGASTATFSTVTIHFLPLLIERGMTGFAAARIFALVGPFQILSRFIIWGLSGRLSALGHGVIVFLLQALSILILASAGTGAWLWAFAVTFGVSSGLLTIVRGNAPAEICDRSAIGRLNGAIGGAGGLSRALMPGLFALLAARTSAGTALAALFILSMAGAAAFASIGFLFLRSGTASGQSALRPELRCRPTPRE